MSIESKMIAIAKSARAASKKMAAFISGHLGSCFAHIPVAMVDLLFKFDRKI